MVAGGLEIVIVEVDVVWTPDCLTRLGEVEGFADAGGAAAEACQEGVEL